jgi:hypothetical protein
VKFLDDDLPLFTEVIDPDYMETAGAANGLGELTRFQIADGIGEKSRDAVEVAPANLSTFEGFLAIGIADCSRSEFQPFFQPAVYVICLVLHFLDLLRCRAFREGNQDVRDVVFPATEVFGGQQDFHFGIADRRHAVDDALAQTFSEDLFTDVAAEFGKILAVRFDHFTHLLHRDLILLRQADQRLVNISVADADAGLQGFLHLQFPRDQPFQDLAFKQVLRRHRVAAGANTLHDSLHRQVEFATQDDVVIHQRHDGVKLLAGR